MGPFPLLVTALVLACIVVHPATGSSRARPSRNSLAVQLVFAIFTDADFSSLYLSPPSSKSDCIDQHRQCYHEQSTPLQGSDERTLLPLRRMNPAICSGRFGTWHPPGFMLLGFPKCGSTSLFDLIHQHPQIKRRLPWFKEIHSLDATGHAQGLPFHDLKGWAAENWSAKQRFSAMLPTNLEHDELCGDGTPWYSIFFDAARIAGRLRIWSPRVRLILLMRQPVRAEWSMQCMAFRNHKAENVARLKSYHPANVRYCGVNSSTVGTCMAHGAATRLDEEIGLQQLCNSATVVQERGA